ncbi:MAG: hypothetical protein ABW189_09170 [Rickettsiales bacterium]
MRDETPVRENATPETHPAVIIQEIMYHCDTGRILLDASAAMASSSGMKGVLAAIDDIKNPKYAYTLGKYLGEYMNKDPEKGLVGYIRYIESIVANPKYSHMKDYHSAVREAATVMYQSEEFRHFVEANKNFMADESPEAEEVKGYIRELIERSREFVDQNEEAQG